MFITSSQLIMTQLNTVCGMKHTGNHVYTILKGSENMYPPTHMHMLSYGCRLVRSSQGKTCSFILEKDSFLSDKSTIKETH